MDNISSSALSTSVFLPLIAGFILLFLPKKLSSPAKAVTLVISIIAFILAVMIFIGDPADFSWSLLQMGNVKLDVLLTAAPLGKFILLFAMGFGLLITIYSLRSMADAKQPNIFYGSVLLTIGGAAGILLSNHLLLLLVFWEIVTVSLYLLITTGGRNSNFAATKSFAMIGASDAAFLLGIVMLWRLSNYSFVISELSIETAGPAGIIAFLLLMTAAVTKAGAMPLHTWVPTSGEFAPTSVMALLPAALDKLLGIYLLVIIVRPKTGIFELTSTTLSIILSVIGAGTIIIAVMVAMVQHNLKKLLSYHAVSQVGYMILGIATLNPVGIAGGIFHMLNNAIYKCCLFLCGGAVEQATGTAELDSLGGLGNKMKITFWTCLIAALGISGVPPLNGFVSKWMVYQGIIKMGADRTAGGWELWPVWLVAAMFGSALTLASFVKIIHSVFLSRLPSDLKEVKEVSPSMTVPMVVLAGLCIVFGVFYKEIPLGLFIYKGLGIKPGIPVLGGLWESWVATALIIIGIIVAYLIYKVCKNVRTVPTWTCGEVQDSDEMIIPGTHFYKTVSSMGGLKQLYGGQEKGSFDLYNQSGRLGKGLSDFLGWLHCGVLPAYLTWVMVGLLVIIFVVCRIW